MILKQVEIHDKDLLDPYLMNNHYGICDYSFTNMFIWRHLFKARYTIHKDYLIILSSTVDGLPHFFMPFRKDDNCHTGLQEIVNDMIMYSEEKNIDFRMVGLTYKTIGELEPVLPQNFKIPKSNLFDYIYNSQDLISLKGKKFHSKRNHINKFNSLYSYEYIDLNKDNVALCKNVLNAWVAENDPTSIMSKNEILAVGEAIDNFEALRLKGGALLIDGKPVAFSMGQPLNERVFCVHIEKALYEIEGAYAKINQEFAARNCGNYLYINREEDLGIEGLRKAKMSYKPVELLYKHIGYLGE